MKSIKRTVIIGAISAATMLVIMCIVLTIIGVLNVPRFLTPDDSDSDTLLQAANTINEHPTDIIVLGDDIQFPHNIKSRNITDLSKEALQRSDAFKYSFFIVNDRNNDMVLSSRDIEMIREYIYDEHYTVVYLGEKYLSSWDNTQSIPVATVDGSLGVAFSSERGNIVRNTGFWGIREEAMMKEYPNILGDMLLYQIEDMLRANMDI